MEPSSDPISVRSMRLGEVLVGPTIMDTTTINKELLLDAIILLFDECNNEYMKTDPLIANFINKCECLLMLIYIYILLQIQNHTYLYIFWFQLK